jgi:hypothetical protein
MGGVGAVEGGLAVDADLVGGAEVRRGSGMRSDLGMAMFVVVCQEESFTELACVGQ